MLAAVRTAVAVRAGRPEEKSELDKYCQERGSPSMASKALEWMTAQRSEERRWPRTALVT